MSLRPEQSLPISPAFSDAAEYVESLLSFVTSSNLFQILCGGVHVLDFLTREPGLYSSVLPEDWRHWFGKCDIYEILDLLMYEDANVIGGLILEHREGAGGQSECCWRGKPLPPLTLLEYIRVIRMHALVRTWPVPGPQTVDSKAIKKLPRHVSVGMKVKKIHEVQHFAHYIGQLCHYIKSANAVEMSQIVDFGSGQNYLGRTIASQPYEKRVIALESKQLNIDGARVMDITAKLVARPKFVRDNEEQPFTKDLATSSDSRPETAAVDDGHRMAIETRSDEEGPIQYIQTIIEDGDLSKVILNKATLDEDTAKYPAYMVVSLHSCGNLLHHGLRSLILNPSVKAVAMVGCCYNLVTERLGPPTYKLPSLRTRNHRLDKTSGACDPHGFPMSEKLATYQHEHGKGIRLNITARMMAVQAPQNWTHTECESFFTRHFYRALLQRIFLDKGLIPPPTTYGSPQQTSPSQASPEGSAGGTPIIIGSLRKQCYTCFTAYVRGAVEKLGRSGDAHSHTIVNGMQDITDSEIEAYETRYASSRKDLSIMWSLMAFSASVVEAIMVVDRWLFLKEQPQVQDCWVQTVFEYKQSPRNLVVVGIKKPDGAV